MIPASEHLSSHRWAGEGLFPQPAGGLSRGLLAAIPSAERGLGAGLRQPHAVMTNTLITSNLEKKS